MNLIAIKKKIKWAVRRHPWLYYVRFLLICKNHKGGLSDLPAFNDINRKEDAHPLFYKVNAGMALPPQLDEFDKALAIAVYLRQHIKGGRGLGLSSHEALQLMLDGKGGVCSDFSQIFNVFCLINDIQVREWGSVEKIYNPLWGHTFNEVYSGKSGKWILIDAKKNVYFTAKDGQPLSVVDLFTSLRNGAGIRHKHFSGYICPKIDKIGKIYSKDTIAFIVSGYYNKTYDHYLDKFRKYPSFIVNAMLILLGKNYNFTFVIDDYKSKIFASHKKTS